MRYTCTYTYPGYRHGDTVPYPYPRTRTGILLNSRTPEFWTRRTVIYAGGYPSEFLPGQEFPCREMRATCKRNTRCTCW
eukprot:424449-Rhodomonas_salina.1